MGIIVTGQGGAVTITLSGEIDHHGARAIMNELEDAVANRVPRELTLDLSGISFMDSSGIAVLLRTHRHMRQSTGVESFRLYKRGNGVHTGRRQTVLHVRRIRALPQSRGYCRPRRI